MVNAAEYARELTLTIESSPQQTNTLDSRITITVMMYIMINAAPNSAAIAILSIGDADLI
jgi:hypothetical protein